MIPQSKSFVSRYSGSLLLAAALLLIALGYFYYSHFIDLPPVQVYVAQKGTAVAAVYGTVTIQSQLVLPINSQNSGFMHLDPALGTTLTSQGYKVKKDQLLCTINDEANTRLLQAAKIEYDAAVARQKLGPPSAGTLKSAQDKLLAYQKLPVGPDGVPRGVARVEYEGAKNDVARVQGAVDNERLEVQRLVSNTESSMKTYQDQLTRTEVRSPIDGTITAQMFNEGAYVGNTAQLFTVSSDAKFVTGEVNEEDVGKLREGMLAEIRLYAYNERSISAHLDAVLPTPDANSSRYTVTMGMINPPDNLRFGLTGEMNIILGRKEGALIIPARALLVDQVLIVNGGVVEQRTVKTGFKSMQYAEITEGLTAGESVIVSDQDSFAPGQRVREVRTNDAPKSGPVPRAQKKK